MAGKRFDWEKVDWTRCNATIAEELGASYGRVAYWRRRLGAPTVRSPRHNRTGEPLVAWNNEVELLRTCRNQDVCRQLKCGLKSVMAARRRLGIPEPVDFTDVDWTLSDGEIARELNCARESVTRERWRRKSGRSERKVPPESRDWSTIDWRLSDCILAWRLGMDKRAVAEKRMRYSTVPESEISKIGGDA